MPVDFEAAAEDTSQAPPATNFEAAAPTPIDFEKVGEGGDAGAALATHRWLKERLLKAAKEGTYPTPEGNKTYEQLTAPPSLAPAGPLTAFEQGTQVSPILNQMVQGGAIPGLRTSPIDVSKLQDTYHIDSAPFTKEQIPNPLLRMGANLPNSAMAIGVKAPAAMATQNPIKTVRDMVGYFGQVYGSAGKAGLWAAASTVAPGLQDILASKGINPDQFVDMLATDPIGVSATLLGGVEAAHGAVHGVKAFNEMGPTTLQPSDIAELAKQPRTPVEKLTPEEFEAKEAHADIQKTMEEQPQPTTAEHGPAAESAQTFQSNIGEVDRVERELKAEENVTARDAWARSRGWIDTPPPFRGVLAPFPRTETPNLISTILGLGDEAAHRPVENPTHQVPLYDPLGNRLPSTPPPTPEIVRQGTGLDRPVEVGQPPTEPPVRPAPPDPETQAAGELVRGLQKQPRGIVLGSGPGQLLYEHLRDLFERFRTEGWSYNQAKQEVGKFADPAKFDDAIRAAVGEPKQQPRLPEKEGPKSTPLAEVGEDPTKLVPDATDIEIAGALDRLNLDQAHADLQRGIKRLGRTLGSGPGPAFSEIAGPLTRIGLYHLKRGLTEFADWSRTLKDDAIAHGLPMTDELAQRIWNTAEMVAARRPIDVLKATAAAINNGSVKTSSTPVVGQANTDAAAKLSAGVVGTGPTSMQALTHGEALLHNVIAIWRSGFGTRSGLDSTARQFFPRVHEQATYHVASRALAFLKTRTHTAELRSIFGEGELKPGQVNNYLHSFADLVADDRARALEARGRGEVDAMRAKLSDAYDEAVKDGRTADADTISKTMEDLGPPGHDVPKLDDTVRGKLLQDPRMQAAIRYFHEKIRPDIEDLTDDLGIKKRLTGPLGLYLQMRQVDPVEAARMQRTRPIGQMAPSDVGTQSRIGAPGAQSPYDVRPGTSRSARKASGKLQQGMAYENDIRYMIENTYADRLLASTKNELREALREVAEPVAKGTPFSLIPKTKKVGVATEKIVPVTLEGGFGKPGEVLHVPQSAADVFRNAVEAPRDTKLRRLWDAASSVATTQVLLLPAEAVRHGFNALSALVNAQYATKYGAAAEVGEAVGSALTLGMSKMATALVRAYKLEGPELAREIERLGGAGGLRLSGYEGTNLQRSVLMRAAGKLPVLHQLKEGVFGDPGSTRGLRGLETRIRVVLSQVIREVEPGLSDAEVAAKINDAYGTYTQKLMPSLAQALQPIDPFSRAGTGLLRSGVKLLGGADVTGKFNPLILAQTLGTIGAIIIYNKMLDEDHKYPWEHPDYRPGDLVVMRRGDRTYRIGFSDLANPLKRGAEFTGLTAVSSALIRGERAPSVLVNEWKRGIWNAWMNRTSPLIKAITSAFTGKSLAQSPSGDFYRSTQPAMTGAKSGSFLPAIKSIAEDSIPVVPKLYHVGQTMFGQTPNDKLYPENGLARFAYALSDVFSVPGVPKIDPAEKGAKLGSAVQRRINQEYRDTIMAIANEALNQPGDKRLSYIQDQIDSRISNEIVSEFGKPAPAKAAALKAIYSILLKSPAANARYGAMQGMNQAQ